MSMRDHALSEPKYTIKTGVFSAIMLK